MYAPLAKNCCFPLKVFFKCLKNGYMILQFGLICPYFAVRISLKGFSFGVPWVFIRLYIVVNRFQQFSWFLASVKKMNHVSCSSCQKQIMSPIHIVFRVPYSRPPIQLLHGIKSILCYEEDGHISYEWDGPLIQQNRFFFFLTNVKVKKSENAIRWPWCLPSTYLK